LIELFRTSTFRLAAFYLGLFATSVLAVLGLIYWETVVYADQQTDETIDAEIRGLAEQYHQRGLGGLIEVLNDRSDPERGGSTLYILIDPRHHPLAGNLAQWPDVTVEPDGWLSFPLEADSKGHRPEARATSFMLAGNYQLLVGRDLSERNAFRGRITRALTLSGIMTLGLGLLGGLIIGRRVLARIEAINRASDQVMAGELGRRIPVKGIGDEFDRLAENLNAMLDRIEELMAGMRQVTDNVAHDLRSPLGRLRGRIEMALRGPSDAETYRAVLEETIGEADQILATFSALLDIAQAEAGGPRAEMAPVDLAEILRDLVDLYEPAAEEAGIALKAEIAGPLPIDGNRHLLNRAVANLIENALKYTPAPGSVTVDARAAGGAVRLTIADTGPGIPADLRDRVFDRFFRLEASRTTPGNGLGLSLARAVIQLHGGTIRLEDNEPGLRVCVEIREIRGHST
jgi:signal transduction histidine kinase